MPEANGYYCQCIHLTTQKHMPPGQEGDLPEDARAARHSTCHQGAYLRARAQLSSSPRSQPICAARQPHILGQHVGSHLDVLLFSRGIFWLYHSKTNRKPQARLEAELQRLANTDFTSRMEAKSPETPRDGGD